LLHEFAQSLRTGRVTHLAGQCLFNRSAMPYLPIVDLVWQSCRLEAAEHVAAMIANVHDHLRDMGMNAERLAPYLLRLLDIRTNPAPLVGLRPELLHVRTVTTVCRMLLASSRQRPVLITIENLQWMDRASEACLASLRANLTNVPILLLVTLSPDYEPTWVEPASMTRIAMSPLTADDRQRVHRVSIAQVPLPADLEQNLLSHSAGNPLFFNALTRFAREQEAPHAGGYLPDSLKDVISIRIERLSEGAKRLLQIAAVLGDTFSLHVLEAIWEGPEDLKTCLLELASWGGCYPHMNAEEPIYIFEHKRIQEEVYERLSQDQRQRLHTVAAQALERLYHHPDDSWAISDLLAYHYVRSGKPPKAVESLIRLADMASGKGIYAEAVEALQEAITYIGYLPRDQQAYCHLDVILRQAQALFEMGRLQESLSLLTPQRARLEQLQDAALTSRYALLLSQLYHRLEDWPAAAQ
ncbi:hypothetical protein C2W62_10835, partial [Candidatus Entotheonella serta]